MLKLSLSARVGLLVVFAGASAQVFATGMWMPRSWIGERGEPLVAAPEFFWELEVKRLAAEQEAAEELVPAPYPEDSTDQEAFEGYRQAFTAKVDVEEFEAALKSGGVKAADPAKALQAHRHARQKLSGLAKGEAEVPAAEEAPGEFADYHAGALAMDSDKAKAKAAWEALLQRPAEDRKYRSTWAASMLGKLALGEKKYDEAVKRFQETRKLVKDGYADALGLAAESYGWEALAEMESGHTAQSARLYLTQLSLGDVSAVVSLKYLVPDRDSSPYSDNDPVKVSPVVGTAYAVETTEAALAKAAADPVLRRLVTTHVLAVGVGSTWDNDSGVSKPDPSRQTRWLAAVAKTGVKSTPDAEYLGWVAYSMGKYEDAGRWLKLSEGTSPAARWLKAKLARRAGDLKLAATLMAEVVRDLPEKEELENSLGEDSYPMPLSRSASCDLGMIQLTRGDYLAALDSFLAVNMWDDAAYVAERVLTTQELLAYVAEHFPEVPKPKDPDNYTEEEAKQHDEATRIRSLLGRRLMREDRYAEARPYLPENQWPNHDRYVAALKAAANEKASKQERARALFTAAWVARYHGMELMGTEGGPDSSSTAGDFISPNTAMERLTGQKQKIGYSDDEEEPDFKPGPAGLVVPVSPDEKKRLTNTKLNPEKRYHYRHVAAGLAWKAAGLLPDQSEITADVLNTAGGWLKGRYPKEADRFIQAIERRCYKTEIGKEAGKKHWFVEMDGPWSKEEEAVDPVPQ
ncbi:hypothetical protein [Verrucomicrobium sp. BvORR106]|uniref:hypothetical protein n=1 Tax=Verrucomicrobium sp. BvORR106 TaxID=1403819 RepID=UPI002240FF10|nr:hypothetical protein [Verrucomicrobium sp. BvORR106]